MLARAGREIEAMDFSRIAIVKSNYDLEYTSLLIELYLKFYFFEQIEHFILTARKKGETTDEFEVAQGRYYQAIGKSDEAISHYRRALSFTQSDDARFIISSSLAECLRNVGKNEDAKAIYLRMMEYESQRPFALFQLSQVTSGPEAIEIEKAVVAELSIPESLNSQDKENLHLALGNFHDKRREYDEAFQNWEISRSLVDEQYSSADQAQFVKDLKSFFTQNIYRRMEPFANQSKNLIFVIGMPRSGTTLVAQILGSHKDAANAGELVRLVRESTTFMDTYFVPRGVKALVADAERGEIAERTSDFLKLANLVANRPAQFIVDKTPQQFLSAGYIHLCFPKAKFINLIRHPADIFISTYQNSFQRSFSYAFNQESFAHYFLQREIIMKHWKSLFPECILDVSYEELTRDPEAQVRRMLDFLGLDWDPACLKFFERPSMVQTFSRDQVRSAINTKSVARWKNYEKHLGPLFAALQAGGYSYYETMV